MEPARRRLAVGQVAHGRRRPHQPPGQPHPDALRPRRSPANQQKLEAADALGKLADDAGMPLVHLAVAWVLRQPGGHVGDHRAPHDGAAHDASSAPPTSTLDDDVLDRIDEIVPPGTNFTWADAGYSPPMIADPPRTAAQQVNATEATTQVQELAARGHVIGDGRSTGASGGTYAHHNPATGVLQAEVPLGGAAEVDDAVSTARACAGDVARGTDGRPDRDPVPSRRPARRA